MSKSKDPKKTKLPYYVGLDKIRNKNHSKVQLKIKQIEMEVYHKRNLNRYTEKLLVTASDFNYFKSCMKQVKIPKD